MAVLLVSAGACSGPPSTTGPAGSGPVTDPTSEPATGSVPDGPSVTHRVPQDAPTITEAIKVARPGDLVLVAPGTYRESVEVSVPRLTIRGLDRNAVVLDGENQRQNGFIVGVDGVSIENLTVHGFKANGILFTGSISPTDDRGAYGNPSHSEDPKGLLHGYRASYVTAYNNGLYGLYAFSARGGGFDHAYASGHPDSGLYIGQCKPCDAVITDSIAEHNAVGYEGTNASGNLFVINSVFRANRLGMTPNSQRRERFGPQGDAVFAGNVVAGNNDAATPAQDDGAFGLGIAIGGSQNNRVLKNLVLANAQVGILVTELDGYAPEGNQVEGNVVTGSGLDLVFGTTSNGPGLEAKGNCFAGNTFTTAAPARIESVLPCPATATGAVGASYTSFAAPAGVDYRSMPAPPPQPSMPDAATAPARPATAAPPTVDLDAIVVPKAPA